MAYAGIPLVDADDNVLGVLCAIDTKPPRWLDKDVVTLRRPAERAVGELALRAA
jgi:GAF domain-containing protein